MSLLVALFCLLHVGNVWGQPSIKISGETEHLKFTVEFTDSALVSQYKDSTDLIKERAEVAWLLVVAELLYPSKYREEVDLENYHLVYYKIRTWEKILEESPEGVEKERLRKARDALGKIYKILYQRYQFDSVVEKWRGN